MGGEVYDAEKWWARQVHPYDPAQREGSCLHRMSDGSICASQDADAFIHQGPLRQVDLSQEELVSIIGLIGFRTGELQELIAQAAMENDAERVELLRKTQQQWLAIARRLTATAQ